MIRVLLFLLSACLAHASEIDMPRFLDALAMKETGLRWNGRAGSAGEMSRYQITQTVWRQHTKEPFSYARVESKAKAVAMLHLSWLSVRIRESGHEVTPERLATTWHYGHTYARRRTTWGEHVSNLYHDPDFYARR